MPKTTNKVSKKAVKKTKTAVPKKKRTTTKKVVKKTPLKKATPTQIVKPRRHTYIFCVGRRKSAVARVRLYKNTEPGISINGKSLEGYFPYFEHQAIVTEPLELTNQKDLGKFSIKVAGGGVKGQAESIRLGLSKILIKIDTALRPQLKSRNLLTTDSRVKERKKYGLKKARRAPQWQKR